MATPPTTPSHCQCCAYPTWRSVRAASAFCLVRRSIALACACGLRRSSRSDLNEPTSVTYAAARIQLTPSITLMEWAELGVAIPITLYKKTRVSRRSMNHQRRLVACAFPGRAARRHCLDGVRACAHRRRAIHRWATGDRQSYLTGPRRSSGWAWRCTNASIPSARPRPSPLPSHWDRVGSLVAASFPIASAS